METKWLLLQQQMVHFDSTVDVWKTECMYWCTNCTIVMASCTCCWRKAIHSFWWQTSNWRDFLAYQKGACRALICVIHRSREVRLHLEKLTFSLWLPPWHKQEGSWQDWATTYEIFALESYQEQRKYFDASNWCYFDASNCYFETSNAALCISQPML